MTGHADLLKAGERGKPGVVARQAGRERARRADQATQGRQGRDAARAATRSRRLQIKLIRDWIARGRRTTRPAAAKASPSTPTNPPVYRLPPVITSLAYSPDG